MQLLEWMISLTIGSCGGGIRPILANMGLIGVIPVIMLRLGSNPGTQSESGDKQNKRYTLEEIKKKDLLLQHRTLHTLWEGCRSPSV